MKLRITKWKWPLVWRKDYEAAEGKVRRLNRMLDAEREESRRMRRQRAKMCADRLRFEKAMIRFRAAAEEERKRADHFQKRCEGYEDAAALCNWEFRYLDDLYWLCPKHG